MLRLALNLTVPETASPTNGCSLLTGWCVLCHVQDGVISWGEFRDAMGGWIGGAKKRAFEEDSSDEEGVGSPVVRCVADQTTDLLVELFCSLLVHMHSRANGSTRNSLRFSPGSIAGLTRTWLRCLRS